MDIINNKYYQGFEGEPEIQFIRITAAGNRLILSIWEGFFDRIINTIEPESSGWTGLALYFYQDIFQAEIEAESDSFVKFLMNGIWLSIFSNEEMEKQIEAAQKLPIFLNLLFTTWPNSEIDCIYPSRVDLIKAILDKSRLYYNEVWMI